MYKCPDCPNEYKKKQAYVSHRRHCKLRQRGLTHWDLLSQEHKDAFQESAYNRSPMPLCAVCGKPLKNRQAKYCDRECYRLKKRPSTPHSEETKRKIARGLRAFVGEPKVTTISCLGCGKIFQKKFKNAKFCSRGCSASVNNRKRAGIKQRWKSGGYREGSGRSKSGWYEGLFCNSTYELIFVAFNLERGLTVRRCECILEYTFDGKIRNYHPDFEINGDIYEVKGFVTKQSEAKREQHPEVIIVDAQRIKEMQDQCSLRGKNLAALVSLYSITSAEETICVCCQNPFYRTQRRQKFCSVSCGARGRANTRWSKIVEKS